MCVVSMIYDHYQKVYPNDEYWQWKRIKDQKKDKHEEEMEKLQEILDLIKDAKNIDEKTNQPNCEKEGFDEWKKSIEKRLKALEKEIKK